MALETFLGIPLMVAKSEWPKSPEKIVLLVGQAIIILVVFFYTRKKDEATPATVAPPAYDSKPEHGLHSAGLTLLCLCGVFATQQMYRHWQKPDPVHWDNIAFVLGTGILPGMLFLYGSKATVQSLWRLRAAWIIGIAEIVAILVPLTGSPKTHRLSALMVFEIVVLLLGLYWTKGLRLRLRAGLPNRRVEPDAVEQPDQARAKK